MLCLPCALPLLAVGGGATAGFLGRHYLWILIVSGILITGGVIYLIYRLRRKKNKTCDTCAL